MKKDKLNVRKLKGPMPKGKKQEDRSYLFKVRGAEFSVYKSCDYRTQWSWESCGLSRRFLRFFGDYLEFKTKKAAIEHLEKRLHKGFYVPKDIPEDMDLGHYALLQEEKSLLAKLEKVSAAIDRYEK